MREAFLFRNGKTGNEGHEAGRVLIQREAHPDAGKDGVPRIAGELNRQRHTFYTQRQHCLSGCQMVSVISSERAWKVHHNQPEKISHANGDIATSELLTLVNVNLVDDLVDRQVWTD